MTDLALAFDPVSQAGDLCVERGDLALDPGLGSLGLMSLLTDARAAPEDVEQALRGDLRGWWGDAVEGRALGGRLWTLGRAKATEENLRRARDFARESLQWLIDDGIAGAVEVSASRVDGVGSGATLRLDVTVVRRGGARVDLSYDLLWRAMS